MNDKHHHDSLELLRTYLKQRLQQEQLPTPKTVSMTLTPMESTVKMVNKGLTKYTDEEWRKKEEEHDRKEREWEITKSVERSFGNSHFTPTISDFTPTESDIMTDEYKGALRDLLRKKYVKGGILLEGAEYADQRMKLNMKLMSDMRFMGLPQDRQEAFMEHAKEILNRPVGPRVYTTEGVMVLTRDKYGRPYLVEEK